MKYAIFVLLTMLTILMRHAFCQNTLEYVRAVDFKFGRKVKNPCGVPIRGYGNVSRKEVIIIMSLVKERLLDIKSKTVRGLFIIVCS